MEPTLSAYEPTWRDRLAQWMLGDQRPTAGQRDFVTGLLGSSGTGSTGASAVDMTPLGGLLSAQESAQHGDYKGAALAALPMPVRAGASMVARAAEEAAPAIERGIIAYHGSPHSFDRFDLSKIGTGEGAQAYGHGLYFADNEAVAKGYRDTLTADANNRLPAYRSAQDWLEQWDSPQLARAEIDNSIKAFRSQGRDKLAQEYEAMREQLDNPSKGSMYQVRINADPEHFLDWDKPLSEQSPEVQKMVFGSRGFVSRTVYEPDRMAMRGHEVYGMGHDQLKSAGIPGIKYLDGGSRSAGDGSRNYVVFDDSMIEILKKYGLVGLLGGGAAMGAAQSPNAQQSAPGL